MFLMVYDIFITGKRGSRKNNTNQDHIYKTKKRLFPSRALIPIIFYQFL